MPEVMISRLFNRRWYAIVPALIVFLPLLFINIRSDHDWGDDFSQYLSQAENISQGRAMTETGYIYNEAYPSLGPKAYPPGLPIMLAPLLPRFGNQIRPYNFLFSVLMILTGMVTVLLFTRYAGLLTALALSVVIFYNPYVIDLKSEIMADVPFALLLLLFILLTTSGPESGHMRWIWAGITAGLAVAFKTAGFALHLALIMLILQKAFMVLKKKQQLIQFYKEAINPGISLAIALFIYLVFYLLFMRGSGGETSYLNTFSLRGLMDIMALNIFVYTEEFRKFFIETSSPVYWFGFLAGAAAITFSLTGLLLSLVRKPGITEWVILIYVGLLLVYPYHSSGFRFLIPITPVLLYYILVAIKAYQTGMYGKYIAVAFATMMMAVYLPELGSIQESTTTIQEGPYTSHSRLAFAKIDSLTPEDAVIAFIKPRALTRYSHRNAFSGQPKSTPIEIYQQMQKLKPTHYLLYSELPDPALENYVKTNRNEIEMIWQSPYFRLYRNLTGK